MMKKLELSAPKNRNALILATKVRLRFRILNKSKGKTEVQSSAMYLLRVVPLKSKN
jgi:hypothetical protein